MRTTKPVATISFNTPDYLRLKLEELRKAKRISFWAFIVHKPEDDEGGGKQHMHVYIEPAKMLQTDDVREELREFDPLNPEKPRGCLTFVSSKFDPWYLYALHDKRYLATKGETRRFHYEHDNIVSSDSDDLYCKAKSIDMLSLSPYEDMIDAISKGISFEEYFRRGYIPIQQLRQFQQAYMLLSYGDMTERNGHENHAMDTQQDTQVQARPAPARAEPAHRESISISDQTQPDSEWIDF